MNVNNLWDICFGLGLLLGVVLGVAGLRDGSFFRQHSRRVMTSRRRWSTRLLMLDTALLLGVAAPHIMLADALGVGGQADQGLALGVYGLMGVATGLPFLYLSGPEELRLDLDTRTYRLVHGWPLLPRRRSGRFEEMAGVYVQPVGGVYYVGVSWRQGGRSVVGVFGRRGRAEDRARELAQALGLALVAVPKTSLP